MTRLPPPAILLLALLSAAPAPQPAGGDKPADKSLKHQDFSTDPEWEGYRNRLVPDPPPKTKQDFGYRPTNHAAGRKPGEIGGRVQRSARPASYAKVIPERTLADRLSA